VVNGEIRVGLFALRNIEASEELLYDYNFHSFGEQQKCNCGSTNCRGVIGTKSKREEEEEEEEEENFSKNYNHQYTELLKEYYSYTNLYSFEKRNLIYKKMNYKGKNLLQYLKQENCKNN
ncbi:hypothetical protein U3516DRAFT_672762, partial [Neocallimastix sp. 'constans']